jgi:hypothetical protein
MSSAFWFTRPASTGSRADLTARESDSTSRRGDMHQYDLGFRMSAISLTLRARSQKNARRSNPDPSFRIAGSPTGLV